MGDRVAAIGRVDEKRSRFAVMMRKADDFRKEIARTDRLPYLAIARVAQSEIDIFLDGRHKFVGNGDRDVEVGNGALGCFRFDETFDVGMVHEQDAHVGAAPSTALGNFAKSLVIDPQKANRSGGDPLAGADLCSFGTQPRKGEAALAKDEVKQIRKATRRLFSAQFSTILYGK